MDIRRYMISSNKKKPAPFPADQVSALAKRLNKNFAAVGQSVAAAARQADTPPVSPRPDR